MLPSIDADQRHVGCLERTHKEFSSVSASLYSYAFHFSPRLEKLTQQGILVSSRDNVELLGLRVVTQPAPTGALNGGDLSVKLLLQLVETTKVTVDRILEHTGAQLATTVLLRSQILPEQRVVDVTTSIEVDRFLKSDGRLDVLLVDGFRELFFGLVESVDVGLVVLGVVQLHDLGRDGGFERSVVVGEIGERVLGPHGRKGARGGLDGASGSGESGAKHFLSL